MSECKVMIKAPIQKARSLFSEYEDMDFERRGEWTLAEDFSGTQLFSWNSSAWVELAGRYELIYAYYDDNINAEFVHVKDGVCLREYTEYDGEVDTDEGKDPEVSVSDWSDVASYMDKHMA